MQVLCGLQGLFLLFNCQTSALYFNKVNVVQKFILFIHFHHSVLYGDDFCQYVISVII